MLRQWATLLYLDRRLAILLKLVDGDRKNVSSVDEPKQFRHVCDLISDFKNGCHMLIPPLRVVAVVIRFFCVAL